MPTRKQEVAGQQPRRRPLRPASTGTRNDDYGRETATTYGNGRETSITDRGTRSIKVAERWREHQATGEKARCRKKLKATEGSHERQVRIRGENHTDRATVACNRDDVIKLQPQSHHRSHSQVSKPIDSID